MPVRAMGRRNSKSIEGLLCLHESTEGGNVLAQGRVTNGMHRLVAGIMTCFPATNEQQSLS